MSTTSFFCSECGRDINRYTIINNNLYCKECWKVLKCCPVCKTLIGDSPHNINSVGGKLFCDQKLGPEDSWPPIGVGGDSVNWPIGIPYYKTFSVNRNIHTACYKCDKPFDADNPPIPASGCASGIFVHGSCWQGCHDGGPHKTEPIPHSHNLRCTVCGRSDLF